MQNKIIKTGKAPQESASREIWVDNVKIIACVLVALGHFFQSMVKAELMPETAGYSWFNTTIYYFHVPLFFICSGYLYQIKEKNSHRDGKWFLGKTISLGIPYVVFSTATWLLKNIFSSSVNSSAAGGYLATLFLYPESPYWYLYCLLLLFLIVPRFQNRGQALAGVLLSVALVYVPRLGGYIFTVKPIANLLNNAVWFTAGMALVFIRIDRNKRTAITGWCLLIIFLLVSLWPDLPVSGTVKKLFFGALGCASIIMVMMGTFGSNRQPKLLAFAAQYTMPIFLMHTLCAAPTRIILLKLGIRSLPIHIVLGLSASFLGPIIAAYLMKKSKWLEFVIYPSKFIKL